MPTTAPLCAASYCAVPGHHQPDCDQLETCRGCLPARAADGSMLCRLEIDRRLAEHADRAARLYPLLGEQLMPHRVGSGPSGTSTGAPIPNERIIELRTQIQTTLVDIARIIVDRRGVRGPLRWTIRRLPDGSARQVQVATGNRTALAAFIGKHAEWLAAQPDAGAIADRLWEIGRHPDRQYGASDAWRAAFPAGPERLYVGPCPLPVREADDSIGVCGERLYQVPGEPLVQCSRCGRADTIEEFHRLIFGQNDSAEVDAYAAASRLATVWFRDVDASLIRKWAQRARDAGRELMVLEPDPGDPSGEQTRPKRDGRHRVLYVYARVVDEAVRHWGPAPKPLGKKAA